MNNKQFPNVIHSLEAMLSNTGIKADIVALSTTTRTPIINTVHQAIIHRTVEPRGSVTVVYKPRRVIRYFSVMINDRPKDPQVRRGTIIKQSEIHF